MLALHPRPCRAELLAPAPSPSPQGCTGQTPLGARHRTTPLRPAPHRGAQMSILTEGEVVNELMIIVDGEVCGARAGSSAANANHSFSEAARKGRKAGADLLEMGAGGMKVGVCQGGMGWPRGGVGGACWAWEGAEGGEARARPSAANASQPFSSTSARMGRGAGRPAGDGGGLDQPRWGCRQREATSFMRKEYAGWRGGRGGQGGEG